MTGEFSRRSFLKYTALTAVAVAGSSLLSGCEYGYNPVQNAPGTSNVVLKVRTTLDMVECHADDDGSNATTIFKLVVTNGRKNALEVTKENFAVKAEGYLAYQNDKLQVIYPELSAQAGRDRHLLRASKGPEPVGERPGDPYLLPRPAVQRVQRQLGAERRRSGAGGPRHLYDLTPLAGRTYW